MNSSWRTKLLWTLAVAAFLVLIVAGFYAEEDGRGLHDWQRCERDAIARGISLEWTNFIPGSVPDDQNFYKAPMMTDWFVQDLHTNFQHPLNPALANSETYSNDISAASAETYLTWCSAFDADFDQIRKALKRPAAIINDDYRDPTGPRFLPNFVDYRTVAQALAHRAKCHLALGEADQALDDLNFLHDLDHTLIASGKPPTLLDAMIYCAITVAYVDAIAYGIESHAWTESQLSALQKQIAGLNTLAVFADSARRERAGACKTIDMIFASRPVRPQLPSFNAMGFESMGWQLAPAGWMIENKVAVVVLEQEIVDSIDLTNHLVMPSTAKTASLRMDQLVQHPKPWNSIALAIVPNITKGLVFSARNQARIDQAQIACALERYRLAHGEYPTNLATLAPRYLTKIPNDIINGKPMIYVRKDDQHFLLYSVGWDETDDGGTIAHDTKGNEDREHGDWVWH